MLNFFDDFGNILFAVVALVIAFGMTERWRVEYQARKKRERQNQRHL
jgi:hypothetical protein